MEKRKKREKVKKSKKSKSQKVTELVFANRAEQDMFQHSGAKLETPEQRGHSQKIASGSTPGCSRTEQKAGNIDKKFTHQSNGIEPHGAPNDNVVMYRFGGRSNRNS